MKSLAVMYALVRYNVLALIATTVVMAAPVDKAGKLSLQLDKVEIGVALQMIAEQNDLNIVVGDAVEGEVSLRLVDVDLESALQAILAPGGYNYYIRNDVVVVKSMATYAVGELVSHSIVLKYLDPAAIKGVIESRLSDRGTMVTIGGGSDEGQQESGLSPNQIVITDLAAVIDEIALLVEQLDQPPQQISIEVKIIESKVDSKSKLGFAWPTSVTTSLGAGTQTISEGSESDGSSESYQAELENVAVSLNPETGRWTWGTLTVDQLTAVLDLLNQAGNSKLISDPHITTLENREAFIKVQTVIPIATISRFSEGAATQDIQTFYDEEVGISLYVTPRINENNRITLDVRAQIEDIIGFAGPSDNQKPITSSRSLKTTVSVNDSETVALGGLLKESEIELTQKFPLLGHIPIIGSLFFTNKSTEKTVTDLIILITPRIMP